MDRPYVISKDRVHEEEGLCPICILPMRGGVITTTTCNHKFHTHCFTKYKNFVNCNLEKRWVTQCPCCRKDIECFNNNNVPRFHCNVFF